MKALTLLRSRQRTLVRRKRLVLESLEPRLHLDASNVFATFSGELTATETSDALRAYLTPSNFTLGTGQVTLGFLVKPTEGSPFRANALDVRSVTRGAVPVITKTEFPDGSSLVLASVKHGEHVLQVTGKNGAKGAWQVQVILVGDVNGDFVVNNVDYALVSDVVSGKTKNPSFFAEADADRDGKITSFDLARVLENRGSSTSLRSLAVTAGLAPASDTGVLGDSRVNTVQVNVAGSTSNGVQVSLDQDGDGFDDGAATVGVSRTYSLKATLVEGQNALAVQAKDSFGQVVVARTSVFRDTQLTAPNFDLSIGSDTGITGDGVSAAGKVTLVGLTDPGETVTLKFGGTTIASSLATGSGVFQFVGVGLELGGNGFTARVEDAAGNVRQVSRSFTRVAPAPDQKDPVLRWNEVALEAIRRDASSPPVATRALAMVGVAILDAVNALEGTPGYLVKLTPPAGASAEAAAATAAHAVLSYLYPGQQAAFDATLTAALAQVPAGSSKSDGGTFGRAVGNAIIALRANDGARQFEDYFSAGGPGAWQPTTPMFAEALLPNWATVEPFAISSPDQFRPAAPPALTGVEYAAAVNEVREKGRATGSTRTADETQSALFWADGLGTVTPAGHWNQVALQLATAEGYSLSSNARLFAQLNVALADAAIASWDAKYHYGLWRPVTAIREADTDNNDATAPDDTWTPLLVTPNFPSYTSGHSTFGGAAQLVLESFFGRARPFTLSTEAPGVAPRSYGSFQQAAEEAGQSRILGGIHYSFDNQAGLTVGRGIADVVLHAFALNTDTRAPTVSIQSPEADLVTATNPAVRGQVLDNLSGVSSLEVKIDANTFVPVAVNSTGMFEVLTAFAVDGTADGTHTLRFRATDFAGNVSSAQTYSFTLDTLAPTISLTAPQENESLTASSGISGIASGTGSAVTALSYSFDGGAATTVVFDPATGAFNQVLDLSTLAVGPHTLAVTANDAAGHTTTTTVAVSLAAAIPLTVTEVSPVAGASEAGSTEKPRVLFSRPINKNTLNGNNFYATDTTGNKLPAHIVIADDATGAWLFFTSSMPGASTITVTVDGATIMAADNSLLDAAGSGTPGSKLTYSFTTVSLASLPGTSLTGILADPGPDLRPNTIDDVRRGPDGVLMTGDDVYLNPISHVRVYILGQETQAVFTDSQGRFTLPSVPSGNVKFVLDGMTATNTPAGCYFPEMVMDLTIEPGKVNTVMGSMGSREQASASELIQGVYLPRLKSAILKTVSNTVPTSISVSADAAPDLTAEQRALLTAVVQPGTAIGANGQVMTNVQLGISTVPTELIREMLPPGVSEPPFTITVQAPGVVTFTTPVAVSYPNVDNAAPGTKMLFISFNHATGRLEIDGTATVSADGKSVVTDPDSGITHPGWHFVQVGTVAEGEPCVENQVCVQVNDGFLGDVIEVDLSGTGGHDFQIHSNSAAGRIAEIDNWEQVLLNSGKFYFIPNISDTEARFTQAPVTAEYTFSGIGRLESDPEDAPERRLFFTVQIKEMRPGYSGNGTNSIRLESGRLNTYRIEQRLKWLGFCGEKATQFGASPTVTVDADLSATVDTQAVKLFQAVIQSDGRGNPANKTGTVGADEIAWLNAANAPVWDDVRNDGLTLDGQINAEYWATSWTREVLIAASANAFGEPMRITSLTEYPDIDWNGSAPGGPHSRHKAGHDIDIGIGDLGAIQSGPGSIDTQLPFHLYQTAVSDDERAVALRILAVVQAAGADRIQAVFIGGTGGEPDYPRIHTILTALGVPNHSTSPGHDDHIHITLKPPEIQAAASTAFAAFRFGEPSISTAPGFGTDARMYYRFELSGGVPLTGRTTPAGGLTTVLTPNTTYIATFYQASTNKSAVYTGQTNASGQVTEIGTIILDQFGGPDADEDGIPDVGEFAIGTNPITTDSDGDGISDSAELDQGLDPLGGRAFPTGVIASLPLQGNPERVAVDGDRVYAATGAFGLAVIDGSRFDGPIVLGQLDLAGTATDVAVDGNLGIAAVATGSALALVDVSEGTQPRLFRTVNVAATRVIVANGLAYAASGNQLRIVDVASGNLIQSLTLPGSGTLTGFAREGSFLYAYLSGSDTFSVIDIANEGAAVVRGQVFVSVASFDVGLFVGNGVAWLSGSGLRTINVSNPASPQIIQTPSGSQFFTARRMVLNGSGLGLLLPDGGNFLQVYDTSNPSNVANLLLQLNLTGNARDVVVSRGVAYVATSNGLEVVNYLPFDNAGTSPAVTATTSAVDQNPTAPGLQLIEGKTIPVRVNVTDDVQVRNVELLVNGQVVRNDVSFPFDFFVAAPSIATVGSSFTIQVRATDTGGNAALSNVLTVELVKDTFAPTITGFVPPTNASVVEPIQVVQVRFSEPMDGASITSAAVRVFDSNDNVLTPTTFQLRDDDRLVQLTFPALLVGTYRIEVSGSVTDRAGNALGNDVVSPFTLTPRASLTTTVPDADPGTAGRQVFEGTTVPFTVSVVAGVSVQKVELIVDGATVATDTTAPYQFSFVAPNIAPGVSGFGTLAKVTDTAGLVTFTTPSIEIGLLEDVTPPTVIATNPVDGGKTFKGVTTIQVTFSEGMAAETFSPTNFALVEAGPGGLFDDGNDVPLVVSAASATTDDSVALLTVAALQPGLHRLTVLGTGISDRAGNPGTGTFTSTFTVEDRPGLTELLNLRGTPVSGSVFLTSDKMTLAVNSGGSLIVGGTGLVFDGREFVIHGTPVWNQSLTYNGGIYANGGGMTSIVRENLNDGAFHGYRFVGIAGANLMYERVIGFFDGDEFAVFATRLTNLTGAALNNVATMENTDPDQGIPLGLGFNTNNDVVLGGDFVRSHVTTGLYPGGLTIGFGSADPRAVASAEGFSNTSPYDIIASPVDPNGTSNDIGINLALNFGTVPAFGSAVGGLVLALGKSVAQAEQTYQQAAPITLAGARLRAAKVVGTEVAAALTSDAVHPIAEAATKVWANVLGFGTPPVVVIAIANLPGDELGLAGADGLVTVDADAGGIGWFIDSTPLDDSEFATAPGAAGMEARAGSPAAGRYDLFTVLLHEIGHVLGYGHSSEPNDLMAETLSPGERRMPNPAQVAIAPTSGSEQLETQLSLRAGLPPFTQAVDSVFVRPGARVEVDEWTRLLPAEERSANRAVAPYGNTRDLIIASWAWSRSISGMPTSLAPAVGDLKRPPSGSDNSDVDAFDAYFGELADPLTRELIKPREQRTR